MCLCSYAFQKLLLFAEDVFAGEFGRRLRLEPLLGRSDELDILHSQVAEQPIDQLLLFRLEIVLRLILQHRQDVKPVRARLEIERTLARYRVRYGTERGRGIGRERGEEI